MNPVTMVVHVLYDTAAGMTGMVGLTPLQVLEGLGAALLLFIVVTFIRANFGDPGWSLEDEGDA
jgi:hypothetical protein